MNHKLLKLATTILALGTTVFAHNSRAETIILNLNSEQNQTGSQQQLEANAPQLNTDNSHLQSKNIIKPLRRLEEKINNNEEILTKIYPHQLHGSNAATLFVRNIPVLTFLGAKTSNDTSKNTDLVEPEKIKISNKISAKDDPISRAKLVASQITKLAQTGANAQDIKVRWNTITKGYSINVKDREIVAINDRTILPDTTKDLAVDALQATNRLRRLMGNAPPLREITDMPRKIQTRLERAPQFRVVRQIVGQASWYGPGFHGRTTANGETYNQHGLTAAHPNLPFGTRIRVTNKYNGRSVVVRVNDRGPYAGGRILDLSAGAARILGMLGSGVAPVQLEILAR